MIAQALADRVRRLGDGMLGEQALVRGLEMVTEGRSAQLTAAAADEGFRAEAETIRVRAQEWTHAEGIEGLGVGEKIAQGQPTGGLALRVYVERKLPKRRLVQPIPPALQVPEVGEIPTDVIELGHLEPQSFRERARPAMPGCGLGHTAATVGTFGGLVKRRGDDAVYVLSNSHVLADVGFGQAGDSIVQPGSLDGGTAAGDALASLTDFVPFSFDDVGFDNLVDAAIARVRRRNWVVTRIRELGIAPAGAGRVVRRGMHVKKVGRTTGYTTGVIQDIHFRMGLTYPRANGGQTQRVGFKDQVLCSRYSDKGDSGAIVLNRSNRVIGLHFAGAAAGSVFNRINHVLRLLRVEFV